MSKGFISIVLPFYKKLLFTLTKKYHEKLYDLLLLFSK